MVKIYLVRHCEAAGNKAKLFQGAIDCDISENGREQLAFLHERFKNIHIDKAFSSPLMRAYKTAMAAVWGKGIEVLKIADLTEINGGELEGRPFTEIFADGTVYGDTWYNHPQNFVPKGGESMREVYERIWRGVKAIADDPENEGKTLLIASHGAAIRNLLCRLQYGSIEKLRITEWSANTAVTLLTADENGISIEYSNDLSHLPEELRQKSASRVNDFSKEK